MPQYNGYKRIGFIHAHIHHGNRLCFVEDSLEVVPGVHAVATIPVLNKDDTHWKYFLTEKDGNRIPDTFQDELFLSIVNGGKLSVISSCSHRGITNIMQEATRCFPLPVDMIAGRTMRTTTQVKFQLPIQ